LEEERERNDMVLFMEVYQQEIKKYDMAEKEERKAVRKEKRKQEADRKEKKKKRKVDRKQEGKEGEEMMGLVIGGEWRAMRGLKTKEIYEELVRKRYGKLKEEDRKTNKAVRKLRKRMTPKQREFWWRCAHGAVMQNERTHKFVVMRERRMHNACPLCKTEVETAKHMEYECEVVQRWIDELEELFSKYVEGSAKEEIRRRPSR